jgi:predicted ATPase/DNA-binding SARP family transcriptional activator/Tfp pilus assembly protein PilF
MVDKLELTLFGHPEFRLGGVPVTRFKSGKSQALLSYLAVTGVPHNRSALAGLLWGSMPEDRARMNLSQALTTLRRFFDEHIVINRQTVAFKRDLHTWIDVEYFKSRVTGFPSEIDIPSLEEAVQIYRGDFLDGFYVRESPEFEIWVLTQRARLRELALGALHTLAVQHSAQGEDGWEAAIDYTSRLLSLEPWHEEAHCLMMRLLALNGRRSAALVQYERCRQILLDELGVEPGKEITALYEHIRDGDFAPSRRQVEFTLREGKKNTDDHYADETVLERETFITNLHPQPTNFVGRERELDTLEDLIIMRGTRLVTLVGSGGIGKTRLALEFASRQLENKFQKKQRKEQPFNPFPNGIYFVSLESLSSPELIWTAIAEAMRFRLDHGEIQLMEYLRAKRLLLVIDNFEHLLDGAVYLSRILKSAPDVHILVTSREQLRLLEEQVYPLHGLEFPESALANNAAEYSAGKLFVQTAQRQRPDFTLDVFENEKLALICQQVEGMPLALELAATWTDTLSISHIAAEIQRNLDFLTAKYRNMPPRHHNLRTVFDVSWKKLQPADQTMFSTLSIFRGGFTLEAATWIAGATTQSLATLVSKSLLRYSKSQDRYTIHELLRQYGDEKLGDRSEHQKEIKDRHSQYYCKWFADQITVNTLKAKDQKAVLDEMSSELENTRAAWDWALQNHYIERLLFGTTAFGLYYAWRGGFKEGERTFRAFANQLVDLNEQQDANRMFMRIDILNWQAHFLNELGDRPKAIDLLLESDDLINSTCVAEVDTRAVRAHNLANKCRAGWWQTSDVRHNQIAQARALYREVDHPFGLPFALATSANLALVTGQMEEARRFYEESLEYFERTGNMLGTAASLNGLGSLAFAQNDYDGAESLLQQAVDIARGIEDLYRVANALMSLGCVYLYGGQFERARGVLERCVADYTDMGLKNFRAASLYYLGYTCLHLGEYDQAASCGKTSLQLALETDYKEIIAQSIMLPAAIALTNDDFLQAQRGFEEADRALVSKRSTRVLFGEDCGQVGLGAAILGLGRVDEAKNIFTELLQQAVASHRQDMLLYTLVGIALLLARQGDAERAVELYSLAGGYPFVGESRWFTETFGRFIEASSTNLPLDKIEAARLQGKSRDLWGTANELIVEFNPSKG